MAAQMSIVYLGNDTIAARLGRVGFYILVEGMAMLKNKIGGRVGCVVFNAKLSAPSSGTIQSGRGVLLK